MTRPPLGDVAAEQSREGRDNRIMSTISDLPHYEFRRFLETTDLGLQEIGEAAGVSHTTVYRWKSGISKPSEGHMEDVLGLLESKHRERAEVVRQLREGLDQERAHA